MSPLSTKVNSHFLVVLTHVFVIAVRSRCLRHLLVVFTHVFVIIAICLLYDIQCFTIIHRYTLRAHFQYSIGELDTLFSIINSCCNLNVINVFCSCNTVISVSTAGSAAFTM